MNIYDISANDFISDLKNNNITINNDELIIISSLFILLSEKNKIKDIIKLSETNESETEDLLIKLIKESKINNDIKDYILYTIKKYSNKTHPNCILLCYITSKYLIYVVNNLIEKNKKKKILPFIYNSLLNKIILKNTNWLSNEYIDKLMKSILKPYNNCTIYDPLSKSGNLLFNYNDIEINAFSEDKNHFNKFVTYTRAYINNDINIIDSGSLENYDRIISIINLTGSNKSNNNINYDTEVIEEITKKLEKKGIAVLLVFNGFLFRQSKDSDFRKHMINEGLVKAVISLPNNIYPGINAAMSILVLSHDNTNTKIINATEKTKIGKYVSFNEETVNSILNDYFENNNSDTVKLIKIDDIIKNNYDLTPSRYFEINYESSENTDILLNKFNRIKDEIKSLDLEINNILEKKSSI